ncbi:MAG TPA: ABC transporter substrate-binding protein [Chthoniobacterales bacterium]|nr:ABC transporter substrate-binding protein [Chthoniobacterales bacterium]
MAAVLFALVAATAAAADYTPGVTATEIKIGNTIAYSGPASAYSVIAKLEAVFFKMVNDQGGVAGRKINFISLDDGYSPPKTLEQVRRLIEQDHVALLFDTTGAACNSAIQKYVNQKQVPHLFLGTGADKFGDYQHYPWTMGFQPSYQTEARIYAKYILKEKPNAKIAILYQNDDFGKDYPAGMKAVLGDSFEKMVVTASYETTDPTIDSQLTSLQAAGADVLLVAASPKFAAQAIRKVHDLDWKPLFFMTYTSTSIAAVINPAGPQNAIGMISAGFVKDQADPNSRNDTGMNEWRDFMAKYMPGADTTDGNYVFAYSISKAMLQVLKQCEGNFTRENIMKQATNLHDLELPTLLPGIRVNTSPTNYHPIRQMQLGKFDGTHWIPLGDLVTDAGN